MTNPRKTRADSRLSHLTADQRDEVFAHCESVSLAEGVAWLKVTFNLTLSEMSLSKWLARQRVHCSVASRLEQIRIARDQATLIGKVVGSATEITDTNIALIAQAVFEELLKPADERDEDKLAKYMSVGLKARNLNLKARSNDLAFERFHFDSAKKALDFAPELQRINNSGLDERAKIEEAMTLLFGKPVMVEV
jgi:uncharacterized protein (DUF342 family)